MPAPGASSSALSTRASRRLTDPASVTRRRNVNPAVVRFVYKLHMAAGKLQHFFGDDWEDTWEAVLSAPGALGNVAIGAARQVRLVDIVVFGLFIAGVAWL